MHVLNSEKWKRLEIQGLRLGIYLLRIISSKIFTD